MIEIPPSTQWSVDNNNMQDFVLEYLVVLDENRAFRETLTNFCNQFSLTVEEDEINLIAASGNDFALKAKSISSNTKFSYKAVLITIAVEGSEYDLQNAREVIEEKVSKDVFREFILLRDSVGEKRTRDAYLLLNELENMLRKVVVVRAASISGSEWWTSTVQKCLPPPAKSGRDAGKYKYQKYREDEVNDLDITHRNDQMHHDIFYLDLSVLKNIVEEEENWKNGFASDLKALRNIDRLDFLNKLRRKIAHNRFLSQRNLDDLRQIHGHLMRLCQRAIGEL